MKTECTHDFTTIPELHPETGWHHYYLISMSKHDKVLFNLTVLVCKHCKECKIMYEVPNGKN